MSELSQPPTPTVTVETPPPSRGGFWTRPITLAVALAVATFIIYAPTLQHDFVDYDDGQYVVSNSHVQAGLTWEGVKWAFVTGEASNWHPLTWLSHMLDVTAFGKKASGHHFTSLVLHCLNAALVLLLLRCLTGNLWSSLIVAALFALHPLHVESVAWVSERKDVLSACFGLLSL
jgi:protein O-mannosyl-transferase